jgi:hypothetical protein
MPGMGRKTRTYSGGCACGAVRYTFTGPATSTYHCHCSRCRRLHGAAFVTWTHAQHERFRLLSSRRGLKFYPSSKVEHRAFCRTCGSHVFAEAIEPSKRKDVYVALATVTEPHDLKPERHIYAESRAGWAVLDGRLPAYGGADGELIPPRPGRTGARHAMRSGR